MRTCTYTCVCCTRGLTFVLTIIRTGHYILQKDRNTPDHQETNGLLLYLLTDFFLSLPIYEVKTNSNYFITFRIK